MILDSKVMEKIILYSSATPGPNILSNVNLDAEEIDFAKKLFSRYSKKKEKKK